MKSNQFSNLVYLPWLTGILKSPRCDIIDWHYDRGLNNSKLTVWSSITVADGGMQVWHFNGVITTYGKRDCRNSWRYASLAVNRGAIYKAGFYCIIFRGVYANNTSLEIFRLSIGIFANTPPKHDISVQNTSRT
jgi:hypothetical protein